MIIKCFCFNCFSSGIKEDSEHEIITNDKVKCLKCNCIRPSPIAVLCS